jgi:hypothetical protein
MIRRPARVAATGVRRGGAALSEAGRPVAGARPDT